MVCYKCGGETTVLNSRLQRRSNNVWRRRSCTLCDALFTTSELIDYAKCLVVEALGNKQLTPFEHDRLLLSLYKSLGHRPNALLDAGSLCTTIMPKLARVADGGVLQRAQIIETVLVALSRFDKLAAQHYQAFHKL